MLDVMDDNNRQEFIKQCRGHILGGEFTQLLALCEQHRDVIYTLTQEERGSLLRINHINALEGAREPLRVLFSFNPSSSDPELGKRLTDTVFSQQDYFMQQVLLFYGIDLTPSRQEYEARLSATAASPKVEAAYAKLKTHTGIDVYAASENNIAKLRQDVGELTSQEVVFSERICKIFEGGKVYLYHESGAASGGAANFRKLIRNNPELYSNDELKRRNLRFPGQTYDEDKDVIGNTDFVFTHLVINQNPLETDKDRFTSVSIPMVSLPEHCFFVFHDWLPLAKLGDIDIEAAVKRYGEDARESWSWDPAKHDNLDYKDAMRLFRAPNTFDKDAAEGTILARNHIIEGIALKLIKHSRDKNVPLENLTASNEIGEAIGRNELLVPNTLKFAKLLSPGRPCFGSPRRYS